MMSIKIFVCIYIIYIYLPYVHLSVYTCLLFQRHTIFLPLRTCAYDVGDTGAPNFNVTCGEVKEGKLCDMEGLKKKKD